MPSNAVAVALTSEARSTTSEETGAGQPLESLARQLRRGRRFGHGRSYFGLLVLVVIAVWVVFMFGRALTELNEANVREAAVRAETAALQARLDMAQRELQLVQTDDFLNLQARGYGMGQAGERVFALAPSAPSPPAITPLGGGPPSSVGRTPLEAWLFLLFGGG